MFPPLVFPRFFSPFGGAIFALCGEANRGIYTPQWLLG